MRRFLLQRVSDPTGVSGTGIVAEGVVFGDRTTVVRWRGKHSTTTVHASLESVEAIHLHGGATRVLWCDVSYDGPELKKYYYTGDSIDGPGRMEWSVPVPRLHDGWAEHNGAVDHAGNPLHIGQLVRLVGIHGEVKDDGEIVDLYVEERGVRIGLVGADCGLCSYSSEQVEAIEKTTKETFERCGRLKPSFGWRAAVSVGGGS